MEEKYYKLDQEEDLELGDESGKIVFLNLLTNKQKFQKKTVRKNQ